MNGAADSGYASRVTVRVRYPETDRMGVAYHGHYLVWFELGRTEAMRDAGCPYGELEDRRGLMFPVVEADVRYLRSARYDDVLTVSTRIESVGGATVRFAYRITRGDEARPLATGRTRHAAVNREGSPMRLPLDVRQQLEDRLCSE